jgi:hypothetical protein
MENFENHKQEVIRIATCLVNSACNGCKNDSSLLYDHDGCRLIDKMEFYFQAINSMNLDLKTKNELKAYFIHNL